MIARVSRRCRVRRALVGVFSVALVLAGGCATVREPLLPYNPSGHGTAQEEWAPHEGAMEWWYLTAVLTSGAENAPYLAQFTIFHFDIQPVPLYMLHLACTDYGSDRHLFEQYVSFDPRQAHGEGTAVVYGNNRIELSPWGIRIRAKGRDLAMDLVAAISEPAVWHGGDGIISMGHPENPDQDSFYYSFVRMDMVGTLSFRNEAGDPVTRRVRGNGWFDRQWGRFREKGWDWFSLRFFDGDRYRVAPLYWGDHNPNVANDYWEGLCRLLDGSGAQVGWCVTETMASGRWP